ncbi:MAG: ABC transporter permease [Flavobacteriales bacterium]|mgnify:CR=1 FL=1|nr:ABC transporter permease [Flavobacteriales bacterium]|tara:strand:- start:2555 stop:3619 length:1065 start_codon:yes stop_codon:yes gene_type:complete
MFYGFLVLWGVISLVFFLFQVMPGDPARMMLSQREDSKQLEVIKEQYGFDKPVLIQYFLYLNDISPVSIHDISDENSYTYLSERKYNFISILSFKNRSIVVKFPYLRESFVKRGKTVNSVISETFPLTIILALSSIIFAIIIGLSLGVVTALYKDTFLDRSILFFSVFGMSLPSFFISIIIAWFFAFILHDFTGLSMTGSLFEVDDYGRGTYLNLKNLILPALTLGIRPLSVIIQLSRSSMLEVLKMDYIRTASAKGLSRFMVVFKHALRNSLNPIVTVVSGWFASLLAGAVFVEYIFAWNGIGKELVDALNNLDMPIVMGSVLIISLVFVIINIMVDITYAVIDPRNRLNKIK